MPSSPRTDSPNGSLSPGAPSNATAGRTTLESGRWARAAPEVAVDSSEPKRCALSQNGYGLKCSKCELANRDFAAVIFTEYTESVDLESIYRVNIDSVETVWRESLYRVHIDSVWNLYRVYVYIYIESIQSVRMCLHMYGVYM